MSSSNHIPGFLFKKKSTVSYSLANFPGEQPWGLCCLFVWPDVTVKACLRWVWGGQENNVLVKSTYFFCFFVSSFFALLFLLFLFFAVPVSVVFLLCCVLLPFLLCWFGRDCVFAGLSIWLR